MKFFLFFFLFLICLPGICQEDDEKLIEDIQARQIELAKTLNKANKDLKGFGKNTDTLTSLVDEKSIKSLQSTLPNLFKHVSQEQMRTIILEKAKGSRLDGFLKNNPKILNALIEIIKDDHAMPSLLGILLRRDDLKIYFFIWLSLIIGSWVARKMIFKYEWSKVRTLLTGIFMSLCVTAISVSIFYNIFQTELSPTVNIVIKHWKNRNI